MFASATNHETASQTATVVQQAVLHDQFPVNRDGLAVNRFGNRALVVLNHGL